VSRQRCAAAVHDAVDRVRRSLEMKQLCVLTTEGHQLIVRAMLNHPSMIKNVDSIDSPYRGEPVGDDQGAAAPQHLVQRGKQLVLRPRIQGSRRLVDDHQRRVAIERARNRHLLPLATRELVPSDESPRQRRLVSGG
jgi:hypothetical protein